MALRRFKPCLIKGIAVIDELTETQRPDLVWRRTLSVEIV